MIERIRSKFVIEESGCWNWTRALQNRGYGYVAFNGKMRLAHRVIYELLVGPIPSDKELHHVCHNRRCVNPEHLKLVTHHEHVLLDNTIARRNALATHCVHGHPFDDENTHIRTDGKRYCRACARVRQRERYARKVASA